MIFTLIMKNDVCYIFEVFFDALC